MHRKWFAILAALGLLLHASTGHAQELLKTDGFGGLSGKVTLEGALPDVVNLLPKMMIHADSAICCAPKAKPIEKIDQTWIVDPKTKAVQNVMIWVKPPKGMYFEIHPKFKVRKDSVVVDQPHCAFLPRIAAVNPVYFDGKDMVETGQKMIIKNSATVPHNVRAIGHPEFNEGFNKNLPPGTEITPKFNPQLLPVSLQCDVHSWMAAKLFVFDHPYYALTKADGTFDIPFVPAGAEIYIMSYHEGIGWVKGGKNGTPITIEKGKKTIVNITLEAPK